MLKPEKVITAKLYESGGKLENLKTKKSLQLPDWYSHRRLKELFQKPQKEDIPSIVAGVLILMTISYLFYHSILVTVFLAPLLVPFVEKMRKERITRQNHEIGQQFKDVLISVATSQKAGYALENAFAVSYKDMKKLYGEQSPICKELRRVCKGLRNNIVLEDLLFEMGERTQNSYIREFANVFAVAKRSGGNITQMLEETVSQISTQTDVEKEIDVMISAGKMEARIMEIVPFAIMAYVGIMNPGFFDSLYGNFAGIAIMTVCLAVYLAAYTVIEKIIDIKV